MAPVIKYVRIYTVITLAKILELFVSEKGKLYFDDERFFEISRIHKCFTVESTLLLSASWLNCPVTILIFSIEIELIIIQPDWLLSLQ